MKRTARLLTFFAATSLALVSSARAQLVTYETQTGYSGSALTFSSFGGVVGQTFTNVSAVASMTYNFFAGSGNGNVSNATSLSAVFGEWNGSSFVGGTSVSFGTISVPASTDNSWTNNLSITNGAYRNFSYAFDLTTLSGPLINATYGYLTDSSKTYALILTDQTGSTNLALGGNFSGAFAYGAAYPLGGATDMVFSQIVVAPGNQPLVPVPEASTVASLATAALVAGLVIFRQRQRRVVAPAALSLA